MTCLTVIYPTFYVLKHAFINMKRHIFWLGSIPKSGFLSRYRSIGFGDPWNPVIFIRLNFLVLILVSNLPIIKTLGNGLKLFPISSLVLVLIMTDMSNKDKSCYWSGTNFNFKTCLGIGIEINQTKTFFLIKIIRMNMLCKARLYSCLILTIIKQ